MKKRLIPRSLRARLFKVLCGSPLPVSTVDLALLVAFHMPSRYVRVWQVLRKQERLGLVKRLPPWPPTEVRPGRRAVRWALTPLGLLTAGGAAG